MEEIKIKPIVELIPPVVAVGLITKFYEKIFPPTKSLKLLEVI